VRVRCVRGSIYLSSSVCVMMMMMMRARVKRLF
jgi:hypothetical protein